MSVIIQARGEVGGGVAAHLQCPHCSHFSKSHAHQLSHIAASHPTCLDDMAIGRLGNIMMYQSTARLFHCSDCFFTSRDFTKLYKHIISRHCMDEREGGGGDDGSERGEEKAGEEGEEEEKEGGQDSLKRKRSSEGEEEEKEKEGGQDSLKRKRSSEGEEEEKEGGQDSLKRKRSSEGEEEEKEAGQDSLKRKRSSEGEEEEKEGGQDSLKRKRSSEGEEEEKEAGQDTLKRKRSSEGEEEEKEAGQDSLKRKRSSEGEEEEKEGGQDTLKRKKSSEGEEEEGEGHDEDGASQRPESEKADGERDESLLAFDGSAYRCLICGWKNKLKGMGVNHVVRKHDIPKAYAAQAIRRDAAPANPRLTQSSGEEEEAAAAAAALSGELLKEEMQATAKVVRFISNRFVCLICGWKTKLKGFAISHVVRCHDVERPYRCKECPRTFFLPSRLQQHVSAAHRPGRYACPFCCFRSHFLGGFRRHCSRCNAREGREGVEPCELGGGEAEEEGENEEEGEEEGEERRSGRQRRRMVRVIKEEEEEEDDDE